MNQVSQGEGAGRTGQRAAGAVEGLVLLMGTVGSARALCSGHVILCSRTSSSSLLGLMKKWVFGEDILSNFKHKGD